MLRLAADENLDIRIVHTLRGQALLTHDVNTMTRFAFERVRTGKPMPGVFQIATPLPIGQVVQDVLILAFASEPGEWEGQVLYLPL